VLRQTKLQGSLCCSSAHHFSLTSPQYKLIFPPISRGSDSVTMSSGPRTTCWTDKPATHTTSAEFPVLPASEVTYQDLKDMFDLHLDPGRDLIEISEAHRLRVPESLGNYLFPWPHSIPRLNGEPEGEFAEELGSLAHGPENVDGCYFDTRTLLFHCLREEMCFAGHNLS
jgi:hypothetical protein